MSCQISRRTDQTGYGPFRPNKSDYHSGRRCYRGGWHRSCPALANTCRLHMWTANIICWHSVSPYRGFPHCKVFAPAAPRRAWAPVSVPISGLPLSWPVPVKGLVSHYLTNSLIGRSPILRHISNMYEIPLDVIPFQDITSIAD